MTTCIKQLYSVESLPTIKKYEIRGPSHRVIEHQQQTAPPINIHLYIQPESSRASPTETKACQCEIYPESARNDITNELRNINEILKTTRRDLFPPDENESYCKQSVEDPIVAHLQCLTKALQELCIATRRPTTCACKLKVRDDKSPVKNENHMDYCHMSLPPPPEPPPFRQ